MPNVAEELFKKSFDTLKNQVKYPVALHAMISRGVVIDTAEKQAAAIELIDRISEGLESGEVAPVPMSALNENGELSKEAAEKLEKDPFALAEPVGDLDLTKVSADIYNAAALVTFVGLSKIARQNLGAL